jgi:hypothetical protein
LRNTAEIADLLEVLRNEVLGNLMNDQRIPKQTRGHFIHGFMPTIYVYTLFDKTMLSSHPPEVRAIIEGRKLRRSAPGEIALLSRKDIWYIKRRSRELESEKMIDYNVSSAEWPGVISFPGYNDSEFRDFEIFKSDLYLTMSRARVYAVAFLCINLRSYSVFDLLKKLEPFANIIYDDNPQKDWLYRTYSR